MSLKLLSILIRFAILLIILHELKGNKFEIINDFPLKYAKPFVIRFHNEETSKPFWNFLTVLIKSPRNPEMENEIMTFNIETEDHATFKGRFVTRLSLDKDATKTSKKLEIYFSQESNNHFVELWHYPSNASLFYKKIAEKVFSKKIIIEPSSNLEFVLQPDLDGSHEYLPNQLVVAKCWSHKRAVPKLTGADFANVSKKEFPENSTILWVFRISLSNHKKEIKCQLDKIKRSVQIMVYHRPTRVVIGAQLDSENAVNIVICDKFDGYPTPTIQWNIISGPRNQDDYYEIQKGGSAFVFLQNTPSGSVWKLNCSAKNQINNVVYTFNKTMTYRIFGESPDQENFISPKDFKYRIRHFTKELKSLKNELNTLQKQYEKALTELRTSDKRMHSTMQNLELKMKEQWSQFIWKLQINDRNESYGSRKFVFGGYVLFLSAQSANEQAIFIKICIDKGEFDDILQWPFHKYVTISILHPSGMSYYEKMIKAKISRPTMEKCSKSQTIYQTSRKILLQNGLVVNSNIFIRVTVND